MLRLRLASLALASGLLLTLSGCCAFCEDGRMFPRLFRTNTQRPYLGGSGIPVGPECECSHGAHLPPIPGSHLSPVPDFSVGPAPMMTMPSAAGQPTPIPITNIPAAQPPNLLKVPQAAPTPYFPPN